MSRLGAQTVQRSSIYVPEWGGWHADVGLDGGSVPTGAITLTSGTLVLQGRVQRSGFDAPDKPRVVVVGGLGWQELITAPISFQSDAGVRLSTVLSALSKGSGQAIEQPRDTTIGVYFECVASRPGEPVRWADVLAELVRNGYSPPWRVDPDGVTRFGARTPKEVSARATVLHVDAGVGFTTYGIDDPAEFLPGNTVNGTTIARVVIRETSGKFEVDVYTKEPQATPAIREQIRRIVAECMAAQDIVRTYTVASVKPDGRLDLVPPTDAPHLPEMKNVEPWTLGGTKYEAAAGEEVVVLKRDNKSTRPIVFGVKLGAGPFAGVARQGDTVTVMLPPATFSGTINGLPAQGLVVWPGQTLGQISIASAKTKAGP
ncbi:MAG TPA: hypothetical protein VK550_12305 [Polyangiaceae bacterium]|nr:hypothetical protein [Polyangiaceae bacterium]